MMHPYKPDGGNITSKKNHKKKAVSIDFGNSFLAKQRKNPLRNSQAFVSYQANAGMDISKN
jgi:hypothetical protein